jgi:hypothetical protein
VLHIYKFLSLHKDPENWAKEIDFIYITQTHKQNFARFAILIPQNPIITINFQNPSSINNGIHKASPLGEAP